MAQTVPVDEGALFSGLSQTQEEPREVSSFYERKGRAAIRYGSSGSVFKVKRA